MATKEEERERTEGAEESEAGDELGKKGVNDLTTFDGRATLRRSSTVTYGFGRTPPAIPCAVRNREKRG